jgi:cob(I)alamin adenosyltransferase
MYSDRIQLLSGMNIDKDSPTVEAIGAIEEAGATLKLLELTMGRVDAKRTIVDARSKLMELARQISSQDLVLLSSSDKEWIETVLRNLESASTNAVDETRGNLIASAYADLARAQCRRAERRLLALQEGTSRGHGLKDRLRTTPQFIFGLCFLDSLSEVLALIAQREEAPVSAKG